MIVVDKRPTMAEWPVRIWAMEEIPEIFDLEARKSMKGTFNPVSYTHLMPADWQIKESVFIMRTD